MVWDFPYGEKGDLEKTIQHNSFLGGESADETCSAQAGGKGSAVIEMRCGRMTLQAAARLPALLYAGTGREVA